MRFLHTADWHTGKTLRGRSRLDEQEQVLAEILDIARRERVDCLLVAGDLFDSYAPGPDAERLVYDFFAELVRAWIFAVVIGGNHDHPRRLGALSRLLDPLRIIVRGEWPGARGSGVVHIDKDGERAVIAALPWVAERQIVDIAQLRQTESGGSGVYGEGIGAICDGLTAEFSRETVNVFMGHMHVAGALVSGSERASHVALPYAVPAERLPASAHYIALGHLHRPQEVKAGAPCAYAGSPLQLDFGEREQVKRVVLVDAAAPAGPAHVESIPLSSGRRLRDLTLALEEMDSIAAGAGDDWLRVVVRTAAPVPGIAAELRRSLPNALDVRQEFPTQPVAERPPLSSFLEPAQLFAAYYQERHGTAPPPELLQRFGELYEEVSHSPHSA
ncbi:MAG: exonuclease SbcCD subunit D [Acidobacteriia bacterium]|nr:exonuclease SbcCD subunit D [Terriglobia bacterium]